MSQHDLFTSPFASIDSADLSTATGGWNPFSAAKSAWTKAKNLGHEAINDAKALGRTVVNDAKSLGHKAVNAAETGINYVAHHPGIFLQ